MTNTRFIILSCLLGLALPAQANQPDEKNCTQAIAAAQQQLQAMPATTPRDKQDLQQLQSSQEKIIADNRRRGVSECQTWSQIMGNAFRH